MASPSGYPRDPREAGDGWSTQALAEGSVEGTSYRCAPLDELPGRQWPSERRYGRFNDSTAR